MQMLSAIGVCDKLQISQSTFFQLRKDDSSFPQPVKITRRLVRWRETDLDEWLRARPEVQA